MKEISNSGTAGASLQVSASEPVEFDATVSEYNGWNQQVKVTNDAGTSSYAYYPDGLRYSKTVNGALLRQVWDGTNLAYEYTLGEEDAAVPVRRYARGINAIYVESGDAKSYYLYNAHGDVVQLTDAAGTVTQEYEYDAFGNEQNPSANDTNPLRYCGEYFDAETGTIYLRARYYDPRIGRFTSADTVLQIMVELSSGIEVPDPLSLNRYTYCHNNPVTNVDPSGNTTFAYGRSINATLFLGGSISLYLAADDQGNLALQFSKTGIDTINHLGLFDIGIGDFIQVTNADSVKELENTMLVSGASGGPYWYLGADVITFDNFNEAEGAESLDGFQVTGGIGVGLDAHLMIPETKTLVSVNVLEWIQTIKSYWGNLIN